MARLVASREAQADLDDILDYLAGIAGASVALRYGERFRAAFRHLVDFPETGARRPRLHADMRIWVVAPYIIFYRFSSGDDTIRIVRIVHGRRNVTVRLFRL